VQACPQLRSLALSRWTDNPALFALASLTSLQQLDLGDSFLDIPSVTDLGVASLSQLAGLTTLSLERCQAVTDSGFCSLSVLMSLQHLNLSHTMVTDAGLSQLVNCRMLSSLSVNGCRRVADMAFSAIGRMSSLTRLEAAKTACRNEGPFSLDGA
jgi:hypothetical protein